jgi:2-polyprenyl-3-methyl-5-hydroxy-6-metoxy-1,4-benzoquinol methylase
MAEPTPEEIGLFAFQVFSKLEGAVTAGMIHLGDRLGLYRALADAEAPVSTGDLAARLGYDERWVREWAYNQGAAGIVDIDDDERLSLSAAGVAVLADADHPAFGMGSFHHLPQTIQALERLPEAFRTGIGLAYDEHGPECAEGVARGFEPWMRANLLPNVLPALDSVEADLSAGALVIDVGCGAGGAAMLLADAFPASRVQGYDISAHALDRARERQAERGLTNVEFIDPRETALPDDGSARLVTTFDCLHDMTDPDGVVRAIRAATADDGSWLLVDIKAQDTYAENVRRNPMASMMYGISVLSCMSSALSEPGGAGLGTLGLSANRAEAMARNAGFTRFRRLDIDHPINAFYEIRP